MIFLVSTTPTRNPKRYETLSYSNTLSRTWSSRDSSLPTITVEPQMKKKKVQISEYHKLLEDLKIENFSLFNKFVSKLLNVKLSESWTNYKQQLKHKYKQMSLSDLITYIIIEDTNRKESIATRTKAMSAKANTVQDKSFHKSQQNLSLIHI